MSDLHADVVQSDEAALFNDVSDDALEVASGTRAGENITLIYGSYCLTCPSDASIG
jgi:hypothetical protein